MQVDEALAVLEETGFEFEVVPSRVPADPGLIVVFSQENFPEDRFVRIFPGTFVPDLTGMTSDQAESVVSSHGLAPVFVGDRSDEAEVVGQTPEPGALVEFETPVEAELGTGGGFPWYWIVVGLVLVVGVAAIRRTIRGPRNGQEEDDEDQDRDRPHRVTAKARLGNHSLNVGEPSQGSTDHALRVELVVGALHQHFEDVDE